MKIKAAIIKSSAAAICHLRDLFLRPVSIIPSKPIPGIWIQNPQKTRFSSRSAGTACAAVAVVVIVKVAVAGLPPGVTAFGETLQVVCAGAPLQFSVMVLLKDPPKGVRVSRYFAAEPAFIVALPVELVSLKSAPFPLRLTV